MAHTVRSNAATVESAELNPFLDNTHRIASQRRISPFNAPSSGEIARSEGPSKSNADAECPWSRASIRSVSRDNRIYESTTTDQDGYIPLSMNHAELCNPRTIPDNLTLEEQTFHHQLLPDLGIEHDPSGHLESSAYRINPPTEALIDDTILYRPENQRAYHADLSRVLRQDFASSVMDDVCREWPDSVENEIRDGHYHVFDDYDALPADDPQRENDFAQFLDNWSLCSSDRSRCSRFEGSQEHVRGMKRRTRETFRAQTSKADIQGLNWKLIGFKRRAVLDARRRLHPAMRNTASLQTAQHEFTDSDDNHRERYFGFRMYAPQHQVHYVHYQLRHNLTATSRDAIFYLGESSIVQASLACASSARSVADLGTTSEDRMRITCMASSPPPPILGYSSDSFLLAGDYDGGYVIVDLNSQSSKTAVRGCVSDAYDGLVTHVSTLCQRQSGLPQATFCSNDEKVRRMDIRTQCFTRESSYDYAINCIATSPDSRLELLVGDDNDAFVRDTERGDLLVTLKTHTDHSFGCAWSPDGRHAATGSQDGFVALWDCRNWTEPLQTFASVVAHPRSLRFTDDGLLVSAEEDDCVSVFDTRNLNERQDIRFFGSIAGVALLDGGDEIVVANADRTVGGLLSFRRKASRFEPVSGGREESCRPRADFDSGDFEAGLIV